KAGDLPIRTAVFAAPNTCAVPFAAASRPKGGGLRISNDMIDRPSVTVRTLNGQPLRSLPPQIQKPPLALPPRKVHFLPPEVIKASLIIRTPTVHHLIGVAMCARFGS